MFKKIVVAVDGSKLSVKAAEKGMEFAKLFEAALKIVYVIDQRAFFFPHEVQEMTAENPYFTILDDLRKNAQSVLDSLDRKAKKAGVEVEKIVREGSVVEQINDVVNSFKADLLIVGAHSQAQKDRENLGSTTQALTTSVQCSLLVTRFK